MTADVFISYSRQDRDKVLAITRRLEDAGIAVWIDQGGIDGATYWGQEIVRAIEDSKMLLLMASQNSIGSENVAKEVMLNSEKKRPILPIHLEPITIPDVLKYQLAGIQHIEYFRGDEEENFKTILRALQRAGIEPKPKEKPAEVEAVRSSVTAAHSMHSSDTQLAVGALAVLPFDNLSPEKETDYFSDGLTEEMITSLSSLSEVEVVSRIVSSQYKGSKKDVKTIARELEARYIVAGSIRKMGENIRISAQLVDAETNRQLWAQTYKGKLDDIFDIQEQVGQQIAESLKLKLSLTEKIALTKRSTVNAQAYDLYLRGREYMYQLTKRSVEYSIQLFEKAFELDPRYAAAYATCSNAYGLLYSLFRRDDKLKDKAQELGLKALMYDSNSADAYAALSLSYYFRQMYEEAISAGKKAIELAPDNFLPYWIVGRIAYSMSDYAEAQLLFDRTISMQPDFYAAYSDQKLTYNALGKPEEAARIVRGLLEQLPSYLLRYPEDGRARMIYAINLAEVNKVEEAKREGKVAMEQSTGDPLMLYNGACLFAQLGDIPGSIKALKDAIAAGHENFDWVKRDSDLDPIRSDPEYIELMKDK
jgi:TolB-like protein